MENSVMPDWFQNGNIDEVLFARWMLFDRKMIYENGNFFDSDGRIPSEQVLRQRIYDEIADYVSSSVSRKVDNILAVLKMECGGKILPLEETRIHLANGTYQIGEGFSPEKHICRYRLPVSYLEDCPEPERWIGFVSDLLEETDILTLQEFMGYCLIPTTIAQKMLIITGQGGEGKSRIGVVMRAMLGDCMSHGSLNKVEMNPFAKADLQHKLLMVDDDLRMEALPNSNNIKSIITAETPVDLERKGVQSYQGMLYTRFMAFGNGNLRVTNDGSYGFFRRQIILRAKPIAPGRVDDPFLGRRLKDEIDGIFLWALSGLYRLIGQNYRFTISPAAAENWKIARSEGNSVRQFLESTGYFIYDPEGMVTTKSLYGRYRDWCDDSLREPLGVNRFSVALQQEASGFALSYEHNVPSETESVSGGTGGSGCCPSCRVCKSFASTHHRIKKTPAGLRLWG